MRPADFALLAVAGGCGAVARFVLDGFIRSRTVGTLPYATIVINLTGSAALGLLTGLAVGSAFSPMWHAVLGSGFLGGYTTFSTASFETVQLLRQTRRFIGVLYGLVMVVVATALAGLGLGAGLLLSR